MCDFLDGCYEDPTQEVVGIDLSIPTEPSNSKLKEISAKINFSKFPKNEKNEENQQFSIDIEDIDFISQTKLTEECDIAFCKRFLFFSFVEWNKMEEGEPKGKVTAALIIAINTFQFENELMNKIFLFLLMHYYHENARFRWEHVRTAIECFIQFRKNGLSEQEFKIIPAFLQKFDFEFYKFISGYYHEREATSEEATAIAESIHESIRDLSTETISLLSAVFDKLSKLQQRGIIKLISDSLLGFICRSPFRLSVKAQTELPHLKSFVEKGHAISFSPIEEATFVNGFDIDSLSAFDSKIDNIQIMDNELWSIVLQMLLIIQSCPFLIDVFISGIVENLKAAASEGKFGEMYSLLLHVLEVTRSFKLEYVLSPAIFNASEPTENIKALLVAAMHLITRDGEESLIFTFQNTVLFPGVFETLISYCIEYFSIIIAILRESETLITILVKSLTHYQRLRQEGNVEFERTTLLIFKLFSMILSDKEASNLFWSRQFLCSSFLSFIFEAPIRGFILSELQNYVARSDANTETIISTIINIFEMQKFNFPKQKAVTACLGLISTINTCLRVNKNICSGFVPVLNSVFFVHSVLRHTEYLTDFLFEVIEMMSCLSTFVTKEQYASLGESLYTLNPIPQKIKSSMIQFAACKNCVEYGDLFIISNPQPFIVLFNTLFSQGFFEEGCQYLKRILNLSIKNASALHQSEFDIILLRFLKEMWFNVEKENIVDMILNDIELIATIVSSSTFVQNFFTLFSMKVKNKQSKFTPKAYELVHKLLLKEQCVPQSYDEMQNNSRLYEKVKATQGLTFICFMFASEKKAQYVPSIFTAKDQNNKIIQLYSQDCDVTFDDVMRPHTLRNALIPNEWNTIILTITGTEVIVLVNEGLMSFNLNFDTSLISIKIGGSMQGSEQTDEPSLLGPFAVYPGFSIDEMHSLKCSSPSVFNKIVYKQIIAVSELTTMQQNNNFVHALLTNCRFELILPLFSITDFGYDYSIDLLKQMLAFGQFAEVELLECEGFCIISHLLTKGPANLVNYKLYMEFYDLLALIKNKDLQLQLIDQILLNSNIWIVTEGEEQLSIHIHWANELIPTFMESVAHVRSFSRILNQYTFFYDQYSSSGPLRTNFNPLPSDFKIGESRSLFTTILSLISLFSFSIEDFNLIVSYCISHPDRSFSQYMLKTLKTIIFKKPSPVTRFGVQIIDSLLPLCEIPEASPHVFEIICYIAKDNVIPCDIQDVLNVFLTRFKIETIQQLQMLIQSMSYYPELLMICCIGADMIGISACKTLAESLAPSSEYANVKSWYIWPLYIIQKTADHSRDCLMRFLVLCNPDQWVNIFSAIELIATIRDFNPDTIKALFISSIATSILNEEVEKSEVNMKTFAYLLKSFIFFRESTFSNKSLMALILNSPFAATCADEITTLFEINPHTEHPENISDFINMILNLENDNQTHYKYSIRLNGNGEWLDANLCMKAIHVLEQTSYKTIDIMICYYLLASHAEEIKEHVNAINQAQNQAHQAYQNILNFKMHVVNDNTNSIEQNNMQLTESFVSSFDNFINNWSPQALEFSRKEIVNELKKLFAPRITPKIADLSLIWPLSLEANVHREAGRSHKNKKMWLSLYGFLQVASIPWRATSTIHYMRDNTACYGYCPFKLKTNWDFKDHSDAAAETAIGVEYTVPQKKQDDSRVKCANRNGSLLSVSCVSITMTKRENAEILIFKNQILIWFADGRSKTIMFDIVGQVRQTTYLHHHNALLLLTSTGKTYFWTFKTTEARDQVVHLIESIISSERISKTMFVGNEDPVTKRWCNGEISNFTYLMYLNFTAGRTYTCSSQYPIMPWVLVDYTSKVLDLKNPAVFRDFTKPVGAFEENRLAKLTRLMNSLNKTGGKGYLYSNGPNCPLTLFLFLLRMEPFTSLHIDMQAGKFDCPERIFSSIPDLFNTIMTDMNDFRELIPEFFYCPEFLKNIDHYNLGLNIKICPKGDVALPPWCSSALEFVYLNRKALESDYVSRNLHHWIDLMFGYKQRGEEAVKASNVYNPELYDTVWENQGEQLSPEMIHTIELGLEHMGQIPAQLFDRPHPARVFKEKNKGKNTSFRMVPDQDIELSKARIVETNDDIEIIAYGNNTGYFITGSNIDVIKGITKLAGFGESFIASSEGIIYREKMIKANSKISKLAYQFSNCVCVSEDNIVRIYKPNFELSRSFPFYDGTCSALFVSPQFHSIAASTKGHLYLFSINNGETKDIRYQNGDFVPSLIAITCSWGFIVSCGTTRGRSYIEVHTINGDFVRSSLTNEIVTSMSSYSTNKGFDYMIFGCESGSVYITDTFYLTFDEPIVKFEEPIVETSFSKKNSTLMALTRSSFLHSYPCSFI